MSRQFEAQPGVVVRVCSNQRDAIPKSAAVPALTASLPGAFGTTHPTF